MESQISTCLRHSRRKKNVKVNLNLAVVGSYSCPPPGTLFENPQRLFVSWVLQTAERKADGFLLLGRTRARSVRPCKFPPRLGPRRAANSCSLAPQWSSLARIRNQLRILRASGEEKVVESRELLWSPPHAFGGTSEVAGFALDKENTPPLPLPLLNTHSS